MRYIQKPTCQSFYLCDKTLSPLRLKSFWGQEFLIIKNYPKLFGLKGNIEKNTWKTPTLGCSWLTLLVACPSEKSSIRGVSYLRREHFLGKRSQGCSTVVKAVKPMFLFRIASIKLLHFKAKQEDQSEPLMFSFLPSIHF